MVVFYFQCFEAPPHRCPQWRRQLAFPPTAETRVPFLLTLPSTCYFLSLGTSHSHGVRQALTAGLTCLFPVVSDTEHLFARLLAIPVSPLGECPLEFFACVSSDYLRLSAIRFVSCFCTLDVNPYQIYRMQKHYPRGSGKEPKPQPLALLEDPCGGGAGGAVTGGPHRGRRGGQRGGGRCGRGFGSETRGGRGGERAAGRALLEPVVPSRRFRPSEGVLPAATPAPDPGLPPAAPAPRDPPRPASAPSELTRPRTGARPLAPARSAPRRTRRAPGARFPGSPPGAHVLRRSTHLARGR